MRGGIWLLRVSFRTRAASTKRCTAGGSGPCGSSPASRTPEETNRRYHYLLQQGQTGLSVAFDLPTLMGYDADHALAEGEVGKCGASISSLEDMEILFRGIPLGDVTVSMTINSPAAVLWAMYLAVAEQQGVDWKAVSGTLQNDILKEYIAQKEYIFPPRPSMRLVTDTIEFGARHTPRFNPISISGYHIREAGSTAVQELAFTLRDGMEYVEWALERGMQVDEFAPAPELLLQRAQRLFRGNRQVSRGAQAVGLRHARPLRREGRAQPEAALSFADGGLFAHVAAALQQRGAHGHSGAGGGAGRHAVPAHEFAGRSLRAAQRAGGDHRAAHAADSGLRERRDEYARPAGRQLFRGAADAGHGAGRRGLLPAHRRDGRDDRGHRERLPAERDRQRQLPSISARWRRRRSWWSG